MMGAVAAILLTAVILAVVASLGSNDTRTSLIVTANTEIVIEKEYDGTVLCETEIIKDTYYFLNAQTDVDITITSIAFNSPNVLEANGVVVQYSSVLSGSDAEKFSISGGFFTIPARITQKEMVVEPEQYSKEFGDADDLVKSFKDNLLQQDVSIEFERVGGEALGLYNILAANSLNPNYRAVLREGSGVAGFNITRRTIQLVALDLILEKTYDDVDYYTEPLILGVHYGFNNLVFGHDAAVDMLNAKFDYKTVNAVSKVVVEFSDLINSSVYVLENRTLDITARILPKSITVIPNSFAKQFGETDNLAQSVLDVELNNLFNARFERTLGEDVNTYNITSAVSENPNYVLVLPAGSGIGKFEIMPRLLTVAAKDVLVSKAYDGTSLSDIQLLLNQHYEFENLVNGSLLDITITAAHFNSNEVISTNRLIVSFSAVLTGLDAHNYVISAGVFEIAASITPRIIDYTPASITKIYGDSDILDASYFDNFTDELLQITLTRQSGFNVGSYDIINGITDNTNFLIHIVDGAEKFQITKRTVTVNPLSSLTKTFNNSEVGTNALLKGTDYEITNTVFGDEIDITVTEIVYNSRFISATSAIVHISLLSANYDLSAESIVFNASITPKNLAVTPNEFIQQYGDADYLTQEVTDEDLAITIIVTFTRSVGSAVDVYDITGVSTANLNYSVSLVSGSGAAKFEIVPREVEINKVSGLSYQKTYDGTTSFDSTYVFDRTTHFTVENEIVGEEVTVTIIQAGFESKDVGATVLTVRYYVEKIGYRSFYGYLEFDAEITPKSVNITPPQFSKVFGEADNLSYLYYHAQTSDYISLTFTRVLGEDADDYDIIDLHYIDNNFNLTLVNGVGKFRINKADIAITAEDKSAVFNTFAHEINTPIATPAKTLEVLYSLSGANNFTSSQPINAGMYDVRISFAGDTNYNAATVYRTLFIERADSVITNTTANTFVYDGTPHSITASLNHDETQPVFSTQFLVTTGTYNNILISVPQTQNYRSAEIRINVTVLQGTPQPVVFPSASNITYGQYLFESVLTGGEGDGIFVWDNHAEMPDVNNSGFLMFFTPRDTVNYNYSGIALFAVIPITVNRAEVQVNFPLASNIQFGQPLSASALVGGSTVFGTFAWENASHTPVSADAFNVIFTPFDTHNYTFNQMEEVVQIALFYPVTFVTGGGLAVPDTTAFSIPASPFTAKSGFIFEGWFLDAAFTIPVQFPYIATAATTFYALWRARGLSFTLNETGDGYIVFGSVNEMLNILNIPSEYRGKPVTAIAQNGFSNNAVLRTIYIPSTVVTIGADAFLNCINLADIYVANTSAAVVQGIDWAKTNKTAPPTVVHFETDNSAAENLPLILTAGNSFDYYILSASGDSFNLAELFSIVDNGMDYTLELRMNSDVVNANYFFANTDKTYELHISLSGLFGIIEEVIQVRVHIFKRVTIDLLPQHTHIFTEATSIELTLDSFVEQINYFGINENDCEVRFFVNNEQCIVAEVSHGQHRISIQIRDRITSVIYFTSDFWVNVTNQHIGSAIITIEKQTVIIEHLLGSTFNIEDFISVHYSGITALDSYIRIEQNTEAVTDARLFRGDNEFLIRILLRSNNYELGRKNITITAVYRPPLRDILSVIYLNNKAVYLTNNNTFVFSNLTLVTYADIFDFSQFLGFSSQYLQNGFIVNGFDLLYGKNIVQAVYYINGESYEYDLIIYNLYTAASYIDVLTYDGITIINYEHSFPVGFVISTDKLVISGVNNSDINFILVVGMQSEFIVYIEIVVIYDEILIGSVFVRFNIGLPPKPLSEVIVAITGIESDKFRIDNNTVYLVLQPDNQINDIQFELLSGYSLDDYNVLVVNALNFNQIFYNGIAYGKTGDDFIVRINNLNQLNQSLLSYPFTNALIEHDLQIRHSAITHNGLTVGFNVNVFCYLIQVYSFRVLLFNNDLAANVYVMGESIVNHANTFTFEYEYDKNYFEYDTYLFIRVETHALTVLNSTFDFVILRNGDYGLYYDMEYLYTLNGTIEIQIPFSLKAVSGITTSYLIRVTIIILEEYYGAPVFMINENGHEFIYFERDFWFDDIIYNKNYKLFAGIKDDSITLFINSAEFKFFDENELLVSSITAFILFDVYSNRYYIQVLIADNYGSSYLLEIDVEKEDNEILLLVEVDGEDYYFIYDEDNHIDFNGELVMQADKPLHKDINNISEIVFFGSLIFNFDINYYFESGAIIITIDGAATFVIK